MAQTIMHPRTRWKNVCSQSAYSHKLRYSHEVEGHHCENRPVWCSVRLYGVHSENPRKEGIASIQSDGGPPTNTPSWSRGRLGCAFGRDSAQRRSRSAVLMWSCGVSEAPVGGEETYCNDELSWYEKGRKGMKGENGRKPTSLIFFLFLHHLKSDEVGLFCRHCGCICRAAWFRVRLTRFWTS